MGKKRGKFSLNGVGTKVEQHAERVLRLVKLNTHDAGAHAYSSLLLLERRAPEKFKTLMAEAAVAAVYEHFTERKNAREQEALEARAARIEQTPQIERGAVSAERNRRKLALNGAGTLSEQHIDRVNRLWSVLLEGNHNMYQYRTRVAFAESMRWLEENEPDTFFTLLESLADMSNGDDAYFIFIRHELNQIQKQVAAVHEKLDLKTLAPTRRTSKARVLAREPHQKEEKRAAQGTPPVTGEGERMPATETEERHPAQVLIFDLLEGKSS